MSRWGKPIKNKRARNPRYQLDELERPDGMGGFTSEPEWDPDSAAAESPVSGHIDVDDGPDGGNPRLAYQIRTTDGREVSGNIVGRQTPLSAVRNYQQKRTPKNLVNAARIWGAHMEHEHGLEISTEAWAMAFNNGDVNLGSPGRMYESEVGRKFTRGFSPSEDDARIWYVNISPPQASAMQVVKLLNPDGDVVSTKKHDGSGLKYNLKEKGLEVTDPTIQEYLRAYAKKMHGTDIPPDEYIDYSFKLGWDHTSGAQDMGSPIDYGEGGYEGNKLKQQQGSMGRIPMNERSLKTIMEGGENFEPRITNGMGKVPGLKDGTQGVSILVNRGKPAWGPRRDGKLQIHVLPKAIGMYESFEDAVRDGMTGESYYMSEEEIEAGTMSDSVRPQPQSVSYQIDEDATMNESKRSLKTIMEGFRKYCE